MRNSLETVVGVRVALLKQVSISPTSVLDIASIDRCTDAIYTAVMLARTSQGWCRLKPLPWRVEITSLEPLPATPYSQSFHISTPSNLVLISLISRHTGSLLELTDQSFCDSVEGKNMKKKKAPIIGAVMHQLTKVK
jgi:hypothetical protein